jgi:hypothetical protein
MPEWWTYSPADFVMFSAQVYYRMFARYNAGIWPLQLATLAAGGWVLRTLRRRASWEGRAALLVLAACWLWIAWAFHLQRYAEFNWPARGFAAGFALEGVLLAAFALRGDGISPPASGRRGALAVVLFAFALVGMPLVGWVARREVLQLELVGVAPDPTAVATIAFLLSAERAPRALAIIPIAGCVASALTLWVLGSPEAAILALVALLTVAATFRRRRRAADRLPDRRAA